MAGNKNLGIAKEVKNDEFYTQLSDIENELKHYKKHFSGKTVFCNCDDPFESNFFKYFVLNFNRLCLKKLIATCYTGSPIAGTQLSIFDVIGDVSETHNKPYKAVVTQVYDKTGDGGVDMFDVAELFKSGENTLELLEGDGDFRSPECLALMDESDIVVTNPPFSLFREYIATLVEHNKGFAILGPQNATHYKEVFPLIEKNKVWIGYTGPKEFIQPDGSTKKFGNIKWYTNLDIKKRHEELILFKHYSPEYYPTYENFDAIDVSKVSDIPDDYSGNMGVPDSFMDSYNPEQFEIIGLGNGYLGQSIGIGGIAKEHKKMMRGHSAAGDLYYLLPDGTPKVPYSRIIIRRKHHED